jgi:hypothetical protein
MRYVLGLLVLLAGLLPARAADPVPTPIRFAAGAGSTTVEGGVIRGEVALYSLEARAGQTMTVGITSPENNAVFQIWQPGARVARDRDNLIAVTGQALPRAGETDDAMRWTGTLPASGSYLIVVGGTRGNASFKLQVAIR